MTRHRLVVSSLAGAGGSVLVGGAGWLLAGLASGVAAWVALGRVEPAGVRARREATRRQLPHVVTLFATALRNGAAPAEAARLVSRALPGPASEHLEHAAARLSLGVDPADVWGTLGQEGPMAALGRTMARSHRTGASVVTSMDRLGVELATTARAEVEDRARSVGVKAALPLGLCMLPAFVLIGIVPVVAGLMGSLAL